MEGKLRLKCASCLDNITKIRASSPRVMPCFHHLCETCEKLLSVNYDEPFLAEMKETMQFKCSHCPPEHNPRRSIFTFVKCDACPFHGKRVVLYCKEETCEMPICQKCVVQEHRTHNFVDFDDERAERFAELMSSIDLVTKKLEYRRKKALEIIKDRTKEGQANTRKPSLVQEFQRIYEFAGFDSELAEKAVELLSDHVSDMEYLRKKDIEIKVRTQEKKTKMAEHKISSPSDPFFVLDEDTKSDTPGGSNTESGLDESFTEELNKYPVDDAEGACLMSEIGLWSLQNCRALAKMDPTYKQITKLLVSTRHIEIMFGGILDQRHEHIKMRALHATLWQKIANSGTFLCL